MLCDVCKKNPATVHLTEIIDDQMNELHLCEDCARNKSAAMEQQFGLSDLLAGMADFEKPNKDEENIAAKCSNCNLTYADFKKIGRLGCGDCYNAFRKYLAPLLKRIHGSNQHVGKSPFKEKTVAKPDRKGLDLGNLKAEMQRAIQREDFEEAARLRDQVRAIEAKREKED
ncbi:MAG: UvrB/UvrC motif-containing protein [Candidatus Omnitrophica bacterium]|jgi:protein arginine kinase activator|nr:UvrB/UvrC motif-containing protein [Candidatus Omnitrophota bacterium]